MTRMRGHIGANPTAHCPVEGHGSLGPGLTCEVNADIQRMRVERAQEKREAQREIESDLATQGEQ